MFGVPFWRPPATRYPGELPPAVDVLVIGGGITGVSLLHHLTERRVSAVLVERAHLASGASGRNAGFLLAGVASSYAEAVRTYGRGKARELWMMTAANHDAMLDAVKRAPDHYRRAGSDVLASGPEEARALEESAELLHEDGIDVQWDGKKLFNPNDGELDPCSLVEGIAASAPQDAIREGVEVDGLVSGSNSVDVSAGARMCRAGKVLLATNAYTPQLVPSVPIYPKRAQMLATAAGGPRADDVPNYSHHGYRYWRRLETGELLIGGWRDTALETEVGYDERPTDDIQGRIEAHLPHLGATGPITHRWAGTMGFTDDGLPLVGPLEGMRNVYLCAGFNGHGLGFAFLSAKELVDRL